jgi:hypothetical protein
MMLDTQRHDVKARNAGVRHLHAVADPCSSPAAGMAGSRKIARARNGRARVGNLLIVCGHAR